MEAGYLAIGSCVGVAILVICLAIPLLQEKIKRNNWYGFRTPRTLSSDEIWYPVNKESAKYMIGAGILIMLSGIALFFLKDTIAPNILVIISVVLTMFCLIGAVIKSFMFLSKFK